MVTKPKQGGNFRATTCSLFLILDEPAGKVKWVDLGRINSALTWKLIRLFKDGQPVELARYRSCLEDDRHSAATL
jgi:hypothetical protein